MRTPSAGAPSSPRSSKGSVKNSSKGRSLAHMRYQSTENRKYNEPTFMYTGRGSDYLGDDHVPQADYSCVSREDLGPEHLRNNHRMCTKSRFTKNKKAVYSLFGSFFVGIRVAGAYVFKDFLRRPRNAVIGFFTVLMLVIFTGSIVLVLTKTPYILLRLSELSTSEIDALITMNGESGSDAINFTDMQPRLKNASVVLGAVPRWYTQTTVQRQTLSNKSSSGSSSRRASSMIVSPSSSSSSDDPYANRKSTGDLLLIDSQGEIDIGLGRAWPFGRLNGNEVQMYSGIANYLGVQGGRGDTLLFDMGDLFKESFSSIKNTNRVALDGRSTRRNTTRVRAARMQRDDASNQDYESDNMDTYREHLDAYNDDTEKGLTGVLKDVFDISFAKYSLMFSNVIFMDYHHVENYIKENIKIMDAVDPDAVDNKANDICAQYGLCFRYIDGKFDREGFTLTDNVMMVAINFRDRYNIYYSSKQERDRRLIDASDSIMMEIGFDINSEVTYPIAEEITTFEMFKAMMVAMLLEVFFAVICLGAVLVFNMLGINAEERQYEMALLRSQGMPKMFIGHILVTEVLMFTLPGVCLGIVLLLIANGVLEHVLSQYTHAPSNVMNISPFLYVSSTVLGVSIPLLATYKPIQRALGSSLRDALDVYRMVTNEVFVVMVKFNRIGIDLWIIILGVFLSSMGFMVYYLVPYSYSNKNMILFFFLLDIVLFFMLVGISLVIVLLERVGESLVLAGLLWGVERRLRVLIDKNMNRHRERNSRVFFMILVTMTCVVSGGLMFSQLSMVTSRMSDLVNGAEVSMMSTSFKVPLDEGKLDDFLADRTEMGGAQFVESWAYRSFPLGDYKHMRSATQVSNLVSIKQKVDIVALTEGFFNSSYDNLNMVAEYSKDFKFPLDVNNNKDVVNSMYEYPPTYNTSTKDPNAPLGELFVSGMQPDSSIPDFKSPLYYRVPAIVSVAAKDLLGVSTESPGLLFFTMFYNNSVVNVSCQLEFRAMMKRVAGFIGISEIPLQFSQGAILIPRHHFEDLLNNHLDVLTARRPVSGVFGHNVIYQQYMYVRLRKGLTRQQRDFFINQLQTRANKYYHKITNGEEAKENLKEVENLVMILYYLFALVCGVMCSIMLWVTFIANVNMDKWSLGVLRSIGFRFNQLQRAALYESISIVATSFVMGTGTGLGIGSLLTSQLSHLFGLPTKFVAPWQIILIMLGISVLSAVFCSVLPMLTIRTKAISQVLRKI